MFGKIFTTTTPKQWWKIVIYHGRIIRKEKHQLNKADVLSPFFCEIKWRSSHPHKILLCLRFQNKSQKVGVFNILPIKWEDYISWPLYFSNSQISFFTVEGTISITKHMLSRTSSGKTKILTKLTSFSVTTLWQLTYAISLFKLQIFRVKFPS